MKLASPPYPVNEVFATIQGEGYYTGAASIFVRLQGCDVGCPWCDTKHTWAKDPGTGHRRIAVHALRAKTETPDDTFAVLFADELVDEVIRVRDLEAASASHVVITGGEPCSHDLIPLITALRAKRFSVQVETSGTYKVPMRSDYWLTLSPKIDMPGGREVLHSSWLRAGKQGEIKLPVGKQADIDRFVAATASWFDSFASIRIYLQPLSQSPVATKLCIEQAKARGWFVSMQTHKFVGIR